MHLRKVVTIGACFTVIATSYVHQQMEIVKAGYTLHGNRSHLARLVDHNAELMYNLSKLESPRNLLASLDGENVRFANRRLVQKENSRIAKAVHEVGAAPNGVFTRVLDLFTPSAEAKLQK